MWGSTYMYTANTSYSEFGGLWVGFEFPFFCYMWVYI